MASLGRRLPLLRPVVRGQQDEAVRVRSVRVRVTLVLMLVPWRGAPFGAVVMGQCYVKSGASCPIRFYPYQLPSDAKSDARMEDPPLWYHGLHSLNP